MVPRYKEGSAGMVYTGIVQGRCDDDVKKQVTVVRVGCIDPRAIWEADRVEGKIECGRRRMGKGQRSLQYGGNGGSFF